MPSQAKRAKSPPERWQPRFTVTPSMASGLMEIEAARTSIAGSSLLPEVAAELRRSAQVRSTHHSTRIEGNRLTLKEAEQVIAGLYASMRPRPGHGVPPLEPRARRVLGSLSEGELLTAAQVARKLHLSPRMARVLLARWVEQGWLEVADPSRRGRSYRLSAIYRQFIGNG